MIIIPFIDLKAQYKSIKTEVDKTIANVFTRAQFIQGEEVADFEREFASYIGSGYCAGVNSGTDALILGVRALDLPPGDEVVVPVNTYMSTALGASENNLKPVFVDIDEGDFGISLSDLKKKITSRTKAVMVAHLYGQPDKIDEIRDIIKKTRRKIYLIEDACQAHGASYKGKRAGSFGVFAAFSFYPSKNLGAYGDGGAIVTDDRKLAEKHRLFREYGQRRRYFHETMGVNSRLDTIQAADFEIIQ
jgi:dTDP-4-amino-4,6-dideoxygalactose transaminase